MILIGIDEGIEAIESGIDAIRQDILFNKHLSIDDLGFLYKNLKDFSISISAFIKVVKSKLNERNIEL